jgi:hypothetical protein
MEKNYVATLDAAIRYLDFEDFGGDLHGWAGGNLKETASTIASSTYPQGFGCCKSVHGREGLERVGCCKFFTLSSVVSCKIEGHQPVLDRNSSVEAADFECQIAARLGASQDLEQHLVCSLAKRKRIHKREAGGHRIGGYP